MRLVYGHRLVSQHVDTGLQSPFYVFSLLGVIAGGHHHVSFLLGDHPVQEIIPTVDNLIPGGRLFGASVVGLDLREMLLQILSFRGIYIDIAGNPGILDFLDESRMEMARVQGKQDNLRTGRAGV